MVKFTRSPIQNSLLKLESSELNRLAVECFLAVMRYMGDYPMASPGSKDPQQTEVDCVYALLRVSHPKCVLIMYTVLL
jgi:myosin-15